MTAQIPDEYIYDEKEYSIVAMSEPINFNPKEYGLNPQMTSTACYRGYHCQYTVIDDEIFLKKLNVYTGKNGEYPIINGVKATFKSYEGIYDNLNIKNQLYGKNIAWCRV